MPPNYIGDCIECYILYEQLGKGGFGEVYRAQCKISNLPVAIKRISKEFAKSKKLEHRVITEIDIHKRLEQEGGHDSLIKCYYSFEDRNYFYLVLELCNGGTLEKYLERKGRFSDYEAHNIIVQIINGIKFLHSNSIIHRDITLNNILLKEENGTTKIKIADFGLSFIKFQNEKNVTYCGTANYMAPEVLVGLDQDFKLCCWGIGCILYALLVGKPPFNSRNLSDIKQKVLMEEVNIPHSISDEAAEVIGRLLRKDNGRRPSVDDLQNFAFFKKYNINSCDSKSKFIMYQSIDSGKGSMEKSPQPETRSRASSRGNTDNIDSCLYSNDCRTYRSRSQDRSHKEFFHSSNSQYSSESNLRKKSNDWDRCQPLMENHTQARLIQRKRNEYEYPRNFNKWKEKMNPLPSRKENQIVKYRSKSPSHSTKSSSDEKYSEDYDLSRRLHLSEKELNIYSKNSHERIFSAPPNIVRNDSKKCISRDSRKTAQHFHNDYARTGSCDFLPVKPSCSHERLCCQPGITGCSHLMDCICRFAKSERNYDSQTETKRSKRRKCSPLRTLRLPQRVKMTKLARASIQSSGHICLEYFADPNIKKYVSEVFVVSPDGLFIQHHKLRKKCRLGDEPPSIPIKGDDIKQWSYENLPEKLWLKYMYAKQFVKIVADSTVKITIYGKKGQCKMSETANFRMEFYDGGSILQDSVSEKINVTDKSGKQYIVLPEKEIHPNIQSMLKEFKNMQDLIKKIKESQESLCTTPDLETALFPIKIGQTPRDKPFSSQNSNYNKENVLPSRMANLHLRY